MQQQEKEIVQLQQQLVNLRTPAMVLPEDHLQAKVMSLHPTLGHVTQVCCIVIAVCIWRPRLQAIFCRGGKTVWSTLLVHAHHSQILCILAHNTPAYNDIVQLLATNLQMYIQPYVGSGEKLYLENLLGKANLAK